MRCTRMKRVRSRFGGTVRRCASFSGGRRKSRGYRRPGAARRGSRCTQYKTVPSAYFRRNVVRCAKFGGTRRAGKRSGYRRGHSPFNKGKKCLYTKIVVGRRGKLYTRCASYGGSKKRGAITPTPYYGYRPGITPSTANPMYTPGWGRSGGGSFLRLGPGG
jgi:hypothetical protein